MIGLLEHLAVRLVPHSRALLIAMVLSVAFPISLSLAVREFLGLKFHAGFPLIAAGLVLGMWAAGLLMLGRWFRPGLSPDEGKGRWALVRRWFDAVFLLLWFLAPFAFLVIWFG